MFVKCCSFQNEMFLELWFDGGTSSASVSEAFRPLPAAVAATLTNGFDFRHGFPPFLSQA